MPCTCRDCPDQFDCPFTEGQGTEARLEGVRLSPESPTPTEGRETLLVVFEEF